MAEVEIKSNIRLGLKELLEGIANLDSADIEIFIKELSGILVEKRAKESNDTKESLLITRIKSTYPTESNEHYKLLLKKLENGKLTTKEQNELIELTDQFEALDAQRLQYLLELTQIRGKSLSVVLKEFSSSPAYA